jgi:hypothetical protein
VDVVENNGDARLECGCNGDDVVVVLKPQNNEDLSAVVAKDFVGVPAPDVEAVVDGNDEGDDAVAGLCKYCK